jgi:hypothetical protein
MVNGSSFASGSGMTASSRFESKVAAPTSQNPLKFIFSKDYLVGDPFVFIQNKKTGGGDPYLRISLHPRMPAIESYSRMGPDRALCAPSFVCTIIAATCARVARVMFGLPAACPSRPAVSFSKYKTGWITIPGGDSPGPLSRSITPYFMLTGTSVKYTAGFTWNTTGAGSTEVTVVFPPGGELLRG